jgi:hypothetical protein
VIARIFASSFLGLPEPPGIDPFIPARQGSVSLIGGCWRQSTARRQAWRATTSAKELKCRFFADCFCEFAPEVAVAQYF